MSICMRSAQTDLDCFFSRATCSNPNPPLVDPQRGTESTRRTCRESRDAIQRTQALEGSRNKDTQVEQSIGDKGALVYLQIVFGVISVLFSSFTCT